MQRPFTVRGSTPLSHSPHPFTLSDACVLNCSPSSSPGARAPYPDPLFPNALILLLHDRNFGSQGLNGSLPSELGLLGPYLTGYL